MAEVLITVSSAWSFSACVSHIKRTLLPRIVPYTAAHAHTSTLHGYASAAHSHTSNPIHSHAHRFDGSETAQGAVRGHL